MKRESTIARIMDVVKRISPKAKWQILWIIGNKLHFVLSGKVEKRYSRIFRRLFNDRISGDYVVFSLTKNV